MPQIRYSAIRERETDFLRPNDVLMVTRIDRLARSVGDLQDIVRAVRAKGANLKATEQSVSTGDATGKAFLDMLGLFAEFETNLRKERQMEGIAKARLRGLQGPSRQHRPGKGAGNEGVGNGAIDDRESVRDRSSLRVPRSGPNARSHRRVTTRGS